MLFESFVGPIDDVARACVCLVLVAIDFVGVRVIELSFVMESVPFAVDREFFFAA